MAAKRTSVAAVDEQVKRRFQEIGLLVIATAALYFLLSLITFSLDDAGWTHSGSGQPFHNAGGETGAWLADFFFSFFGLMAYLFPLMIIYHAVVVYREREKEGLWLLLLLRWGGFIITVIAGASIADLHFLRIGASLPGSSGGLLGETVGLFLFHQLGATGATLILLTLMLIGITLLTNLSWLGLCETIGRHMLNGIGAVTRRLGQGLARRHEKTKTDRARTQELNKSERPAVAQRRVEPLIGTATRQGGSIDDTARQTKQSASTAEPEAEKKAEKRTLKIRRNEPIDPVTEPGDEQRKGWSDYNLLELEQMFQSERAAEPSDQAPGTNPFLKHDDPSAQPHHSTQSEATPETNAVESDHQPAQPQHQTPSEEPPLTNANPTDDRSTRPRPGNRPDEPLLSPEMATKINPHVPRDLFAESSPPEPDAVEMPAKKSALPSHDDKPALHTEWLAEAETVPVRSARAIDRGEPEILASREAITKPNDQVSPAQPVDPAQPNAPGPSSPTEIPVKQSKQPASEQPPQRLYQNRGLLPPLSLLDETTEQSVGYSRQVLEEMSRQVEVILSDFGVEVEVVAVEPGPVITRFEVQPAAGVKVSRITNLAKDLARALSVTSVRVVEIIPGKSVIGLEIPNRHRDTVHLREVLSSKVYHDSLSPITLVLGKDIGGNPVVADLAKMPHLLVAGTTGSGKSVAVNTMILSMLYKATPKQVRLIMIDPKMLELSVYEEIPHLLTPVVTDMKEAANALRWSVAEMDRRYRLMSRLGVRNLASFNQKVNLAIQHGEPIADPTFDASTAPPGMNTIPTLEPLPSIVIVIDELADMMMIVGKKVEELIARLAQKARAAGLHLILATQRPSVDVLTGLIKANIPTRLAFQVATKIDSRTILDQSGAETLLGNGDMLFLPPGTAIPDRAHGAFVSDDEVNSVVEFLKRTGPRDYISDITKDPDDSSSDSGGILSGSANSDADPLYDQAVKIVTESRKASISNVQRRLKIGYNRAARMLDEMEESGIIGALEPNGAREVLAPPPPSIDG